MTLDGGSGVTEVRAFAPASVSNVACGFDTLGFAIQGLGDEVTARPAEPGALRVTAVRGDDGRIPTDPERNTAAVAAAAVLRRFAEAGGGEAGVEIEIDKRMPLSSGLGSSAASAVAGAVAAHGLLQALHGFELETTDLLECALAGELIASGSRHADNVAPCLLGGFVLVRSLDGPADIVTLPKVSDWLWCALARPSIAIDTLASRQRMGESLPLATAIRQWANLGALVAAVHQRDIELLGRALVDHVAEPARRGEVPGFDAAMAAARSAGALGGSLSGSGPTLFALCPSAVTARAAADAMAAALEDAGAARCDADVSTVGAPGARLVGSIRRERA